MTLHELMAAIDQIVTDGRTEVVVETDWIMNNRNDPLALRIELVEKIGGRIVIRATK